LTERRAESWCGEAMWTFERRTRAREKTKTGTGTGTRMKRRRKRGRMEGWN